MYESFKVLPLCDKYLGTSSQIQEEIDLIKLEIQQRANASSSGVHLKKIIAKSMPSRDATVNVVQKVCSEDCECNQTSFFKSEWKR